MAIDAAHREVQGVGRELQPQVARGTAIGSQRPLHPEAVLGEDLDMAVVSRSYESLGESGSVGVIGPMRMNYKRAISAVEEVTRELEEQISARTG